ncbi:MAG TPA: hypothetical protein VG733_06815, partial [Chthoniobacteraceae bacterium]|nr:hypothetical protein [Chthoniobacteraceae bacterium]
RDTGKYYSSMPDEIEVTEGKIVWEQTVGVPANADEKIKGAHRTISVLTFMQPKYNYLYVRVQDKDTNTIYSTSPLGILIATIDPDIKLDRSNTLHVLQLVGPRQFIYSRVDLNGGYEQVGYSAQKSRPVLKKDNEGEVYVAGGEIASAGNTPDHPQHVESSQPAASDGPKVSDRPPGFPTVPGGQ